MLNILSDVNNSSPPEIKPIVIVNHGIRFSAWQLSIAGDKREKNDAAIRQATSDTPPETRADENDAREKMIQRMKNHGKEE